MKSVHPWDVLIRSLFDWDGREGHEVQGPSRLGEWLELVRHDFDDVDRMILDHETIGG